MNTGLGFFGSVLALVVTGYLTLLLVRRRSMPAAKPLLGFVSLAVVYLVLHTALYVPGPLRSGVVGLTGREFVFGPYFHLQATFTPLAGTFWFVFALQYSGRGEQFVSRVTSVLAVFWATMFVLVAMSWLGGLEYRNRAVFEATLSLGLFIMTGLLVVGTMLVAETAWQRNAVGGGEAGLLAGGATAISMVSLVSGVFTYPFVPPLVLTVGASQFVVAIRRYPVFGALPITRVAGRDRLLEELDDPVVVVDQKKRLRDLNESAAAAFGLDRADIGIHHLDTSIPILPDPDRVLARDDPVQVQTAAGSVFSVSADVVTDKRDRQFGYVLRCMDVTDRQQREQRLGLLHQLLTGKLLDHLSTIARESERLVELEDEMPTGPSTADRSSDTGPETVARTVRESVGTLKTLVSQTRDIERDLADMTPRPVSLSGVLDETVSQMDSPPETITRSFPTEPVIASVDPAVLQRIVSMLLTDLDSDDHDGITLHLEQSPDGPRITLVTDSGVVASDTPEHETSAGDDTAGTVTREIAAVAVESLGGTITIGDSEIVLTLPEQNQHGQGNETDRAESDTERGSSDE